VARPWARDEVSVSHRPADRGFHVSALDLGCTGAEPATLDGLYDDPSAYRPYLAPNPGDLATRAGCPTQDGEVIRKHPERSGTMTRALVVEEDSGTCRGWLHPHSGYYAGDFSGSGNATLETASPSSSRLHHVPARATPCTTSTAGQPKDSPKTGPATASSRLAQLAFGRACSTRRQAECCTDGDPRPKELKERAMSSNNASGSRSPELRSDGQFPSAAGAGRTTGVWT
jgi:hypothetical protein